MVPEMKRRPPAALVAGCEGIYHQCHQECHRGSAFAGSGLRASIATLPLPLRFETGWLKRRYCSAEQFYAKPADRIRAAGYVPGTSWK
jgi:hypothetical protein